jgi:predicted nucleotide-binding protein (sugar kinase/HSP70/actin superfamily)
MQTLSPEQQKHLTDELQQFELAERVRLQLPDTAGDSGRAQWRDDNPTRFALAERDSTTILTSGLPDSIIRFVESALAPAGFRLTGMSAPTQRAYDIGKEFGNRGQCNPTYFTVGRLIEYLMELRDGQGLATKEIIRHYLFVTAGGCGPCRMGMYATEYRKALRDAGFEGFRVVLLSRAGGSVSADASGLVLNKKTVFRAFSGFMLGDILSMLALRNRPYEIEEGATDRAVAECRDIIGSALAQRKSLLVACLKCRKVMGALKVDRTDPRPRVLIQGEFWAKTTEGDGNYNLFRFLEKEGAEVVTEPVSDWLLHQIWRAKWNAARRETLAQHDDKGSGHGNRNPTAARWSMAALERVFRLVFATYAHAMGLKGYKLNDHAALAELASPLMDSDLGGGEDHMEIGHHIHTVQHRLANMVLSVKPFTCLSSNGVSDGIQPAVTELHPQSVFVSVETNGDAPANFYSRVQMQLFKAKKAAQRDMAEALEKSGMTLEAVKAFASQHPELNHPLHVHPQHYGCVTANMLMEIANRRAPAT